MGKVREVIRQEDKYVKSIHRNIPEQLKDGRKKK